MDEYIKKKKQKNSFCSLKTIHFEKCLSRYGDQYAKCLNMVLPTSYIIVLLFCTQFYNICVLYFVGTTNLKNLIIIIMVLITLQ